MTKAQFRDAVRSLLNEDVADVSQEEKIRVIERCIIEEQRKTLDASNKGDSWSDAELRVILKHPPTDANCVLLARAFGRGYGSIEQIFRWAETSEKVIDEKRPDDAFVKRVKRAAKEMGWRAA